MDILEIIEADSVSMIHFGTAYDLPGGDIEKELCIRAYRLLQKDFGLPPVGIYLHKNIPVGAGMGGGSSDAAWTLRGLNGLFNLGAQLQERYRIKVVAPGIHVSTAEAYASLTPDHTGRGLSTLLDTLPVEEWKDRIVNDFERPVFARYPELARIKQSLYDEGAVYASMSGSGSALYGIFRL